MRIALALSAVLLSAVCVGSIGAAGSRHKCTHVSRGFRACTVFLQTGEKSTIVRRSGSGWTRVSGPVPGRRGWWRRVVAAMDRKTLLGQWSGECEAQSTYFVSAAGGRVRAIFRRHESTVVGWTVDGQALVRLNEAVWRGNTEVFGPGVYRVDPLTLAVHRLREKPARNGC